MKELKRAGLVAEAGLAAYRARNAANQKKASYEQPAVALPTEYERRIRAEPRAWRWFRKAGRRTASRSRGGSSARSVKTPGCADWKP